MSENTTPDYIKLGDGYADITLVRGLSVSGVNVKSVRMREPTVADQLAADEFKGGDAAKEIQTMANLCQVAPDELKALTLKDYKRLQTAFLGFIS